MIVMKKNRLVLAFGIICFLLFVYSVFMTLMLIFPNNGPADFSSFKCLSTFSVTAHDTTNTPGVLSLENFHSFGLGVFTGKIANYTEAQADKFANQIEVMMKNQQIITFMHLSSDVCLTSVDKVPGNGVLLQYQIQHRYCTNSCTTGRYALKVNLSEDGSFIGYQD